MTLLDTVVRMTGLQTAFGSVLRDSGSAPKGAVQESQKHSPALIRKAYGCARSTWLWLEGKRTQQLALRRMRVTETLSLGEKRFVHILQVDSTQFLIGGTAANVQVLATLHKEQDDSTPSCGATQKEWS